MTVFSSRLGPGAAALLLCGLVLVAPGLVTPAWADNGPGDIGGSGKIEPRGGVIEISGAAGAVIRSIKVRPGQHVKKGDLLMVQDDSQPQTDARIAAIALDQATRHAKDQLDDEALNLKLVQGRYDRAKQEAEDYRSMGPNATSLHQMNLMQAAADDAQAALAIERRKYQQMRKDTAADVESARRRADTSRDKLATYQVTAPSDGVILRVNQHEGEYPGPNPAIEMGDISAMYVTCQVFQGDLLKVRPGARATISGNALDHDLTGRVENVSRIIQTTAQLGDVRIRLDDTALASRLVGMEVDVKIAR